MVVKLLKVVLRPAIVEATEQCDLVKTETFAPILYVLKYSDLDEAINIRTQFPRIKFLYIPWIVNQEAEHLHQQ